ncbi:MAG: ABC-type transport auxiliary lipoprotein family protein [Pseudomonadota bacterium]
MMGRIRIVQISQRLLGATALLVLLSGCSALPTKPVRAALYDFGPGSVAASTATSVQANLPPVALDEVETAGGVLDNLAVLYRLTYADSQQLRPYSQARWSMPVAQLVRQRLRDTLSRERPVFRAGEGPALTRVNGVLPSVLRVDLDEFSQVFESPESSVGLIRLRVSLLETTPEGQRLKAQRQIVLREPAPTQDAPGGVRALTTATDRAALEISDWLKQQLPPLPGR